MPGAVRFPPAAVWEWKSHMLIYGEGAEEGHGLTVPGAYTDATSCLNL